MQVNGLRLEQSGRFEVQVLVEGNLLWSYPLYVEEKSALKQTTSKGG
jgi:hypothetical protein